MTIPPGAPRSVAGLAQNVAKLPVAFQKIFSIKEYKPACQATAELNQKYGVPIDNIQTVLAVTNEVTHDVCWYNPARGTKPQNFSSSSADVAALDPLLKGGTCDFCDWSRLTAADTFGRVEGQYAVSASNLFKYCGPAQGVVLFKHHNPLEFSHPQLADLLNVAAGWFDMAAQSAVQQGYSQSSLHPLLVWNCLNRAGASQYHGHAQTMLSGVPLPQQRKDEELRLKYESTHKGADYLLDVYNAHDSIGLARSYTSAQGDSASLYVSVCPWKDAEIVIQSSHLTSPAFQLLFYCVLRALIDELGIVTFNAGISGIPVTIKALEGLNNGIDAIESVDSSGVLRQGGGMIARLAGRGKLASAASDYGGLEVFAASSIAHTEPYRVIEAVDRVLKREGVLY